MNESIATTAAETTTTAVEKLAASTVLEAAAKATETIAAETNTAVKSKISRLKSWPMWLGILGALWMFLSALGIPAKIGLSSETYNSAINAAGAVLVALGVVNNPTTAGLSTTE